MTTIDLRSSNAKVNFNAVEWLIRTFGPPGDRWKLRDLTYIDFRKDRDATLFLLNWTEQ